MAKEVVRRLEDSLQLTRPRRSTNHAGTGQRASVDTVTSATSDMMLTCSTQHQTLNLHDHQKRPLHFFYDDSDVDEPPFMIASNVSEEEGGQV